LRPKGVVSGETLGRILDVATELIQTRGYSAISYHDIASRLELRKASIHYYFPSKADLGKAVIARYSESFGALLTAIEADVDLGTEQALRRYSEPFRIASTSADKVCLCAALAGEILAVPTDMQNAVRGFFNQHHLWIQSILERGCERGDITLRVSAPATARMIFSTLQGSVLVSRSTGNDSDFEDTVSAILASIQKS
jgi:TetR/AcrR family transcriptional repressor of nem operon